jgi:fatty-acyl-CoA synthase
LLNADEAIGEIVNRDGVANSEGYYNAPEAEAERTRGGWYWTGDLGYRDEDGFFYFAGRSADRLRVESENFTAGPIETILYRLDDVVMVAVYPVPDPDGGDQVMAALELRAGASFDPDHFAAFLDIQPDLGTKWAPRFVRIMPEVPVTGTNKVRKTPLRREHWACRDPVWWRPDRRSGSYRLLTGEDVDALHAEFAARGRLTALDVG